MNKALLMILFATTVACTSQNQDNMDTKTENNSFYVGTYTDGVSEGIYKYVLKNDGTLDSIQLLAKTNNPSFLAISDDKNFLVAASEVNMYEGNGAVELFKIDNDSLEFINRSNSGGAHPCYVAINSDNYVLTANYSGGNIGLFKITDSGELTELLDLQQHTGSGTHSRQDAPHAHSACFVDNSNVVIGADLGTNEIWFYKLDENLNKLIPTEQAKLFVDPEAGPRHIAFHPNGNMVYVLNELNGTISLVEKQEDGTYKLLSAISTLPEKFDGYNKSADIHITRNGKYLYASNRGPNNLAIFSINDQSGELSLVGFEPTRGDEPRNFALSPDEEFLLVANQHSNNIVSFKRDKESGLLSFVGEINAPAPVCILFE